MAAAAQQKDHLTQSLQDTKLKLDKSRQELSTHRGALAQSWKVRYVTTIRSTVLCQRTCALQSCIPAVTLGWCRPAGSWFLTFHTV